MNWIKSKIFLLPTNEKVAIVQESFLGNKRLILGRTLNIGDIGYHLYFTSDEEIKEGDWCMQIVTGTAIKPVLINKYDLIHIEFYKKIIATTDKTLKISTDYKGRQTINITKITYSEALPEPSKEFLEVYVKAYNEGKKIEEVLIEYVDNGYEVDMGGIGGSDTCWMPKIELKTNSSNEISIKKLKDNWSREEVVALLHSAVDN